MDVKVFQWITLSVVAAMVVIMAAIVAFLLFRRKRLRAAAVVNGNGMATKVEMPTLQQQIQSQHSEQAASTVVNQPVPGTSGDEMAEMSYSESLRKEGMETPKANSTASVPVAGAQN